jgi:hypothetical protein
MPGGAAGLTSIGLGLAPGPRDLPAQRPSDGRPPGIATHATAQARIAFQAGPALVADSRFALAVLGGALAGVYLIAAGQLIGHHTATAMPALGIGLVQAVWSARVLTGTSRALLAGAVVNLLLVGAWTISHTFGLTGSPQPVGVLDAFCAADSVAIALLAGGLALAPRRLARARIGVLRVHLPILLAAASLSVLAGGHTHSSHSTEAGTVKSGTGAGATAPQLYCRLL